MDYDAFSHCGSSSSVKSTGMEQDPYVPVNYISPEACALLLAAEASAARCADDMDASVMNLKATYRVSATQIALDGCLDTLGLPKPSAGFHVHAKLLAHHHCTSGRH